jgi:hypothetical protein
VPSLASTRAVAVRVAACLCLASLAYAGYREHWFLTDDAFITFRYASNHLRGWGYTWNPPPFRPVEGYTSFLWLVLLEGVWRVLAIEPPESANPIGFLLGLGTLGAEMLTIVAKRRGHDEAAQAADDGRAHPAVRSLAHPEAVSGRAIL